MVVLEWIKKRLARKYKLSTGDLVKDLGDGFSAVEDPGIVIELFPDRYQYRHPLFFGLLKIDIDGILVRWLDKKGTTHVYPACCVDRMRVSEERARQLRTTAEERFDKPKEPSSPPPEQVKLPLGSEEDLFELPSFDDEPTDPGIPPAPETTEADPEPEKNEKRSLNKMQEQLREVERIIKERSQTKDDEDEGE